MGYASDQATPDEDNGAIGSTDLTDNTVELWDSIMDNEFDFPEMKEKLDNWRHRNAKRNYIDRRFIIGSYDAEIGKVELNPNFEPNISGDFEKELDDRLKKVQEKMRL